MTLLMNAQSVSKSYGSRSLFENLSLSLFSKDKVGLIGPNGAGKSTLLKILAKIDLPDSGDVSFKKELKVGYVPQTSDFPEKLPIDILIEALHDEKNFPLYEKQRLAETWLSKLQFKDDITVASQLSGGWKKRLALAKELIVSPDVLLLDEPTNHLDLEGILWLESFLKREVSTFILVSHDRYFLQNVVNRIVEIDRGYPDGLFSIEGSYLFFLQKKGEFLEGQLSQERSLASKARQESAWLKSSPKARTTKAQSRIDHAHEVLEELSVIKDRNRRQTAKIAFAATERETRKLLVVKNLGKRAGTRFLFRNLDFTLTGGLRIGLMGPNGSGKTTLLKLISGENEPDEGTLKRAENLKVVYFDQHRTLLKPNTLLKDALSPTGDYVFFRGQRVHVNGWCKRFLFSPDLLQMPIKSLSGGERARIAIAHLMLQPADLLLLDEPTNDLDVPTLETLEESLLDFPGAVVLITHDRCMLDRVCDQLLALGDAQKTEFYADYNQWQSACRVVKKEEGKKAVPAPEEKSQRGKLSYRERQEYQQIEGEILKLEQKIEELNQLLEDDEITQKPEKLQEVCSAVGVAENQIEQLYLRWEELDQKINL